MITYQDIIEMASEIANNEKIIKKNLTLIYELDDENHRKLDEDLFYRTKQHENGEKYKYQEIIEVNIGDIKFKFVTKKLDN